MCDNLVTKIVQAGGKYGAFPCPFCEVAAHYKFTASSGWCQKILHLRDFGATVYDCNYMKGHLLKMLGSQ